MTAGRIYKGVPHQRLQIFDPRYRVWVGGHTRDCKKDPRCRVSEGGNAGDVEM